MPDRATKPSSTSVPEAREWLLPSNSVTPYLRSRWFLSPAALVVRYRRTALGVIPMSRVEHRWSLHDLGGTRLTAAFFPSRLIVAAALFAVMAFSDLPPVVALATGLIAIGFLFLTYVAVVQVRDGSGEDTRIPVCALLRRRCRALVETVNSSIDGVHEDDGSGRRVGHGEDPGGHS